MLGGIWLMYRPARSVIEIFMGAFGCTTLAESS
jgi:hypothetical protein